MTRDSVAKKVRLEKEQHPERFCPVKGCLWRTKKGSGIYPCAKHPGQSMDASLKPVAELAQLFREIFQ